MAFELPPLPFAKEALEPHISAKTFEFHHGKHHNAYVTTLNSLIKDTPLADKSLEDIITTVAGDAAKTPVFNNAAQVWNHTFFWNSLSPTGGGQPTGAAKEAIDGAFGSLDAFKEQFKQAGVTQFGSGWAWLVVDGGKLSIAKTPNAELPLTKGQTAVLTCDVWEHAYYLDYQNRRPDFLQTFLDHLVNWDFLAANLAKA
ncbi:superoxide dismutase [Rhodospirillum rubrum]|nr:superoxide dismutase [Rhodospirillum rubrum]QXG82187.1 superoxide dismutase [Rhodospirillum rubrum]